MTTLTITRPVMMLTPAERDYAYAQGDFRDGMSVARGDRHRPGLNGDPRECHRMGAAAEFAVSKWSGLPWSGYRTDTPPPGTRLDKRIDVGENTEVRATRNERGGLVVRCGDLIEAKFVLVICRGLDGLEYELCGWLFGVDIRVPTFERRNSDGTPWWQAGQPHLLPLRSGVLE